MKNLFNLIISGLYLTMPLSAHAEQPASKAPKPIIQAIATTDEALLEEVVLSMIAMDSITKNLTAYWTTTLMNSHQHFKTEQEFEEISKHLMQQIMQLPIQLGQNYVAECYTKKNADLCAQLDTVYQAMFARRSAKDVQHFQSQGIVLTDYVLNPKTGEWQKNHANKFKKIHDILQSFYQNQHSDEIYERFEKRVKKLKNMQDSQYVERRVEEISAKMVEWAKKQAPNIPQSHQK